MSDKFAEALGKAKVKIENEEFSNFGTYVWIKANGKAFTDGNGSVLSIESYKNDKERVQKLVDAAKYYGEPDGRAVFYPNTRQISDETHSEQVDRMKQGLIPSMNDLGAVIAAKKTLKEHGDEG
jgi:pyrroloquinoline quinone (PQQ) biosynthesis protein C